MASPIPDFKAEVAQEQARLGRDGALRILDAGRSWSRKWDLASTLRAGGAVVFPHIGLEACGAHTAAAVHACLDSDANRVLAIGVLHAITQELEDARVRVARGGDVTKEPAWGIQGPELEGRSGIGADTRVNDQPVRRVGSTENHRSDWQNEFSLLDFLFLWQTEIERRGIPSPELIVRYPYLAGGRPEILPGIRELREIVGRRGGRRDAAVVATADPFHHGIGYGDSSESVLAAEEGGLDLARRRIEEGLTLLRSDDYWAYNQHCVDAKSDARDVGQVLPYLLGPLEGRILDLTWTDTSAAYGKPDPTWVAGALIELQPERPEGPATQSRTQCRL
jgi:hypothetical protein